MDIEQVSNLLSDESIVTIKTKNSIEEYRKQDENFYKLEFTGQSWEFLFVMCEKNSQGITKTLKSFNDESSASKYFFLFELSNYYFDKYILPFQNQNKDINISEPTCTIENLKEAFNRLNIGDQYFSFSKSKEHSVCLNVVNDNESSVKFIGNNLKEIFETPVMDNWLSYYAMYKFVYYLYLLDKKYNSLLKENIDCKFTDQDYDVFMS